MPAVSKAQYRYMQMRKHGKGRKRKGQISSEEAAEFVANSTYKGLPERASKRGQARKVKRKKRVKKRAT